MKLALHNEGPEGRATRALASAKKASELGGGVGDFTDALRGDEDAKDGYGRRVGVLGGALWRVLGRVFGVRSRASARSSGGRDATEDADGGRRP